MGKLEGEVRKKTQRQNIRKIILNTIYGAGMLSVAMLAPNAVSAITKLTGGNFTNKNYRIKRSITRLIEDGLVFFDKTPKGTFARLTPKGQEKVEMLYAGEVGIKKPTKWDNKWRVVIYDLRESKKGLRDKLRITLVNFGFAKLQDSVWIYPYDCEDLINLIKLDFKIGKEVLYLIVDRVENDKWIKRLFNIP